MPKTRMEGAGEFYQHYPSLAAIITCRAGGRENAMAAAWHCALSREPALYGVAISPKRYTHGLVLEAGEFGVNFLPFERVQPIAWVGGVSGSEVNKLEKFQIAKDKALKTSVPILKDAYASLECKLIDHKTYGDHEWFVGEIVATHLLEEAFTDEQALDLGKVNPAFYLGIDLYATTLGESVHYVDRKDYTVSPPSR